MARHDMASRETRQSHRAPSPYGALAGVLRRPFVALLVAACVVAAAPARAQASVNHTQAEAVAWANARAAERWNVDYDGAYGVQCVDLILAYYDYLVGWHTSGNAIDYTGNQLPGGWTRTSSPQAGDVVVWNKSAQLSSSAVGGGNEWANSAYGHIGIVTEVRSDRIVAVETNTYYTGTPAAPHERLTSGVACYIHPDFVNDPRLPDYDYGAAVTLPEGDGEYIVASAIDPRYMLDVEGGSSGHGANVQVYEANGTAAQRWRFEGNGDGTYTILNAGSGCALDVDGLSMQDGGNVKQYPRNGSDAQRWWVEDCGDGTFALKAVHSRGFLDVAGGMAASGSNVWQWRGNGTPAQRWLISRCAGTPTALPQGDGEYTVASAIDPRYVLDLHGGLPDDGTNVQVYEANGTAAQRWRFVGNGDGTYTILNAGTGGALDVEGASFADGANVHQWSGESLRHRRWWVEDMGDGTYAVRSAWSGRMLDVAGGLAASGSNVWQWGYNGTQAQRWLVEPVPDLSRDGWVDLPGGAKGYVKQGGLVKGWLDIGSSKYWFDGGGVMATGWTDVEVSGNTMHYYFNPASGNLARGTWMTIDGAKYYFRPSGNVAHGWATISDAGVDKKYYFDDSYQMVTGWQDIEVAGSVMHYYFRPSGAMATGWAKIDGVQHFFRPSGNMATGFTDVPEDAYKRYFDSEGRMLTGWQRIGANTYYFRASGAMQTGDKVIDGVAYRFTDKGVLVGEAVA